MDATELSKVAEIISGLGQDATNGLMAYLGAGIISNLLGYGVGCLALYLAYKLLAPLVSFTTEFSNTVTAFKDLRIFLGTGTSGVLTRGEISSTVAKIKEMVENQPKS